MRLSAILFVALAIVLGNHTSEPNETVMERAFAARLSHDVGRAMKLASDVGGGQAVARIRDAGMDRFTIRSFTKLGCDPATGTAGHVCRFTVDIDTAAGHTRHTLTGRFYPAARGIAFAHQS